MQGYKVIVFKENPEYKMYIEDFEESESRHLAMIEWYKDIFLLKMERKKK